MKQTLPLLNQDPAPAWPAYEVSHGGLEGQKQAGREDGEARSVAPVDRTGYRRAMPAEDPPASSPGKGTGRRRNSTAQRTRVKIMEAAERLFGDRGIEAAPLREIAVAAGQANTAAVQYHFGSKEQLVYGIFEYRSLMFEPMRAEMLVTAGDRESLSAAKVLLQILCLPHISIADENGAHPYSAFLAEYITRTRPRVAHPFDSPDVPLPALRTVHRLLVERLSYLPIDVVRRRVGLCKLLFLNMLMRRDSGYPFFGEASEFPEIVDDTFEQMVAGLIVPHRVAMPRMFEELLAKAPATDIDARRIRSRARPSAGTDR